MSAFLRRMPYPIYAQYVVGTDFDFSVASDDFTITTGTLATVIEVPGGDDEVFLEEAIPGGVKLTAPALPVGRYPFYVTLDTDNILSGTLTVARLGARGRRTSSGTPYEVRRVDGVFRVVAGEAAASRVPVYRRTGGSYSLVNTRFFVGWLDPTADGEIMTNADQWINPESGIHYVWWDGGWVPMAGGDPPAPTPPTITATVLDTMTEDAAFSQALAATGSSPITWAVTAGTLPAGLSLSTGGLLSGTPTTPGAYSFTVTATNTAGDDTQAYSGTVEAAGPPAYDSFVTEATVGPVGWWESGTGSHVQEWTPPYANGFQFKALANIAIHGARFWRPAINGSSSVGTAPEIRLSEAGSGGLPVLRSEPIVPADPPTESGWVTVLFDTPYEAAVNDELYIWVASLDGTAVGVPLAREADYFTAATESIGGLMESLDPTGRYATPFDVDDHLTPWGTVATVWYWIDPLALPA